MDFWKQMEASMSEMQNQEEKYNEKRDYIIKLLSEAEILDELSDGEKGTWIDRYGEDFNTLYVQDKNLHDRLGNRDSHHEALQEMQKKLSILSLDKDLVRRINNTETKEAALAELQEKFSQQ